MKNNRSKTIIIIILICLICSFIMPFKSKAASITDFFVKKGSFEGTPTYQYKYYDGLDTKGNPTFVSETITEKQHIDYWLHSPEVIDEEREYPLVVYIGGSNTVEYVQYGLNGFNKQTTSQIDGFKRQTETEGKYLQNKIYGSYLYKNPSYNESIVSGIALFNNIKNHINKDPLKYDCYILYVTLPDEMWWKDCANGNLLTIRTSNTYFRKTNSDVYNIPRINEATGDKTVPELSVSKYIYNYNPEYAIGLSIKINDTEAEVIEPIENEEDPSSQEEYVEKEWEEIDSEFYEIVPDAENDKAYLTIYKEYFEQLDNGNYTIRIDSANELISFDGNKNVKEFTQTISSLQATPEASYYSANYRGTYLASQLSPNIYSQLLIDLISTIETDNSIDKTREYIAGFSVGATFAFDTIAHYPNKFASAFIVAPTSVDVSAETTGKLRNMNIWCFSGSEDHTCNKYLSKALVDAIKENSGSKPLGKAQYTIFDGGHTDNILGSSSSTWNVKSIDLLKGSTDIESSDQVIDFMFDYSRQDVDYDSYDNDELYVTVEVTTSLDGNRFDYTLIAHGNFTDNQEVGFIVENTLAPKAYDRIKSFTGCNITEQIVSNKTVKYDAANYDGKYISYFKLTNIPKSLPLKIKAYAISDIGTRYSQEIEIENGELKIK